MISWLRNLLTRFGCGLWRRNSFRLSRDTPWWKREYRGKISPFDEYEFSLSLETLTGRPNVRRPSPTTTHRIVGSYSQDGENAVLFLTFYCDRLKQNEAIAVQEEFRSWWLSSLELYKNLNVLSGYGRAGL